MDGGGEATAVLPPEEEEPAPPTLTTEQQQNRQPTGNRRRKRPAAEPQEAAAEEESTTTASVPANPPPAEEPAAAEPEATEPQQEEPEDDEEEPATQSSRLPPKQPPQTPPGTRRPRGAQAFRSAAPPAGLGQDELNSLAEEERELLAAPLRIDRTDLYPTTSEPHFLVEPPAPGLGEVHDRYVELPPTVDGDSGRTFRRMRRGEAAGALVSGAKVGDGLRGVPGDERFPEAESYLASPSGGVQAMALLIGIVIHLAQGGLAGLSLLQWASTPWPTTEAPTLVRPMAYAPAALPLHRTSLLLAYCAFLGACDSHAAAPRLGTALLLVLYAVVVLTCILQLPTDVALSVGRETREPVLSAALLNTLTSNGSVSEVFRPDLLAEMQLEEGMGAFSTKLSAQQLGFWQANLVTRAVLSTLGWAFACLLQARSAFGVPPIDSSHGAPSRGYDDW